MLAQSRLTFVLSLCTFVFKATATALGKRMEVEDKYGNPAIIIGWGFFLLWGFLVGILTGWLIWH
jgi:hypothetical protein